MTDHILFDLDGTVADTAPDLAHSLNLLRYEHGLTAIEFSAIRPLVSLGAVSMIKYAFNLDQNNPEFETLRQRFLALYRDNLYLHTRLFPGMESVLDFLDKVNIRWGIVTNKPGWLTIPLLDAMDLSHRTACIVSGDSLPERKPSPAPLIHACRLMACPPAQTTYIGDAASDIQAGHNAGMTTGIAHYGYLEPGAEPRRWGADFIFHDPVDILHWLQRGPHA